MSNLNARDMYLMKWAFDCALSCAAMDSKKTLQDCLKDETGCNGALVEDILYYEAHLKLPKPSLKEQQKQFEKDCLKSKFLGDQPAEKRVFVKQNNNKIPEIPDNSYGEYGYIDVLHAFELWQISKGYQS